MVRSNAHGSSVLFTNFNKRNKPIANALQFSSVRFVCVYNFFELLFVGIVPRIHTNLLYNARCNLRGVRSKVNIGDKGNVITSLLKFFANVAKILSFIFTWGSNSYQLTTGFNHANTFGNSRFCIHRVCRSH